MVRVLPYLTAGMAKSAANRNVLTLQIVSVMTVKMIPIAPALAMKLVVKVDANMAPIASDILAMSTLIVETG